MGYFIFCLTLIITLFSSTPGVALQYYASTYATYINFNNSSIRNDGWAGTAYFDIGDGLHNSLELGFSETFIDYIKSSDLNQIDFTIVYSNINQLIKNHIFRFGFHYIDSDDPLTDNGKIFYFKSTYFQYNRWNTGLELDYSDYKANSDISVFQIRPHFGFYFSSFHRRFYSESRLFFIIKKEKGSDNYYSFEQVFSFYIGHLNFILSGWFGKQIFAVKNDGFVVYNLSDRYLGGLLFEVGYKLTNNIYTTINYNYQRLRHIINNEKVGQSIITFSLGYSF